MRINQGEIAKNLFTEEVVPAQCKGAVPKKHPGKVIGKHIFSVIAGEIHPVPVVNGVVHLSVQIKKIEAVLLDRFSLGELEEKIGVGSAGRQQKGDFIRHYGAFESKPAGDGANASTHGKLLSVSLQYLVRPEKSVHSFQVSLAGYPDLNLDKVFSTSANHFREHLLIDLLPSEISLIEIELANGNAFRFTQDENGDIACSPINQNTTMPPGSHDELTTRLLFSYFTAIRYKSRSGISLDSITVQAEHSNRIARLLVVSHQGEEHTLQIFPFREKSGDVAHLFKALVFYNNDPGALIVNYIYLDVLMRDLPHYFGE